MIWLCAILFGGSLTWAFMAKIDQTVTVRGRLEPSGSVREVDSPSAGVVSKVFVKDGDEVKQGQSLFDVEAKGLASRREALETTLSLFELQARTLKIILRSSGDPSRFEDLPAIPTVDDPTLNAQLITARQQSQQFLSRLEQIAARLSSRRSTMQLKEQIASDMKPLFESGAMARNQYLLQLNQVQETRADVASLQEERSRVVGQIASQLNQINRQMIQIRAELVGLNETISYRTVRAPISGKVFDVKVSPQTVVNADQDVLRLVPANKLQAQIAISDRDIGFVKVGLPVNVSVDSFPSGEFGYIRGTLTKLGSDVLPPDRQSQQYRFPATVSLQEQSVLAGEQKLNLQSGMGVSANIKLRSRPVISIISDLFTKQLEGVKRFR
ncbi:HlyD family efflux transporter periplasmic adaptor subunit [Synechococcus sp. MU1642]|nr:HlyD family efflux transporter periplasmic adaptor subunit [Synechococcus sp. MU1642]